MVQFLQLLNPEALVVEIPPKISNLVPELVVLFLELRHPLLGLLGAFPLSLEFLLGHLEFLFQFADELMEVVLPFSNWLKLELLTELGISPLKLLAVHEQLLHLSSRILLSSFKLPYPRLSLLLTMDKLLILALKRRNLSKEGP